MCCIWNRQSGASCRFDYSLYGKLQALFPEFGAVLEDTAFGADVTLTFRIREDRFAAFEKALTEKPTERFKRPCWNPVCGYALI